MAVLISPSEYDSLIESRRRLAREDLQARLVEVRKSVLAAGLDVSVVDEAITAARSASDAEGRPRLQRHGLQSRLVRSSRQYPRRSSRRPTRARDKPSAPCRGSRAGRVAAPPASGVGERPSNLPVGLWHPPSTVRRTLGRNGSSAWWFESTRAHVQRPAIRQVRQSYVTAQTGLGRGARCLTSSPAVRNRAVPSREYADCPVGLRQLVDHPIGSDAKS